MLLLCLTEMPHHLFNGKDFDIVTKKEKEELERKQQRSSKTKSIIIILVVLIIAFIAFFLFKEGFIPFGKEESSVSDPTNSVSDMIDNSDNESNQTSNSKTEDENTSDEPTSDETTSNEDEKPNHNDGSVYSASLPLTIDDALAILNSRYGSGYRINMSTSGSGYHNFAVFKDDERYATVSVNLSTGDATETIMDTGNQTKFNLLK